MAEPQLVDPHDPVMTGENSFIRLSNDGGKTLADRVYIIDHGKAMDRKQSPPVKDQKHDSEAIERAVYDGMRDLRAGKSR